MAYHGRASSIVLSGTPIKRPWYASCGYSACLTLKNSRLPNDLQMSSNYAAHRNDFERHSLVKLRACHAKSIFCIFSQMEKLQNPARFRESQMCCAWQNRPPEHSTWHMGCDSQCESHPICHVNFTCARSRPSTWHNIHIRCALWLFRKRE